MQKQAVEQVSTPELSVGSLVNTINPFISLPIFKGKYWYPEGFKPTGNNSTDRLLFRTGVAGTAAAALALLARTAFNQVDMETQRKERQKFLEKQLASDTPEFNPGAAEQHEAEALKQKAFEKQLKLNKSASDWAPALMSSALPILALYGGTVGGFKLADKLANYQRKLELDKEVRDAQQDLNAMNLARLSMARETPEQLAARKAALEAEDAAKLAQREAFPGVPKEAAAGLSDERTLSAGATNLAGLLLGMVALGSGYASYNYFKAVDPERQAQSDVKTALGELARSENEESASAIARPKPATLQSLDAHLDRK